MYGDPMITVSIVDKRGRVMIGISSIGVEEAPCPASCAAAGRADAAYPARLTL
jgi:hypothetical protein